jgi:hypothetical protein
MLALAVALQFAVQIPVAAQDAPTPAPAPAEAPADDRQQQSPTSEDEIVVVGEAVRGRVDAPQPPILELNEADIAAYGAGSLAELMQALAPQTGSSGGRGGGFPVILVNGVRISSFREIRSYPPEAIEKLEVFPEEVAQRYGYSPDQRVVNIILKRNFSSREFEVEYGQPWDGGYSTNGIEATYLQLLGQGRLNFNLNTDDTSLLTEAERGIVQSNPPTYPTDPDPAEFRSLISDSAGIEGTANYTTRLGGGGSSLSLNATFQRNDSLRYQGLDSVVLTAPGGAAARRTLGEDDPLTVDARTDTFSLGTTLNNLARRLADHRHGRRQPGQIAQREREIRRHQGAAGCRRGGHAGDRCRPARSARCRVRPRREPQHQLQCARDRQRPAVAAARGRSLGNARRRLQLHRARQRDTRNPGLQTSLDRGDISAGVNISIPIASRREDHWAAIGDVSFNIQAGIDELSDFGTLTDVTLGLNWGVTERLNFGASYIMRDAAPSLGQLGNPEIVTRNVPIYDISRNETVLATIVTGGNPDLPAQSQRDWRANVSWELPGFWSAIQQGRINLEYSNNSAEDVSAGFPSLTPTIEAAFPDRVTRDATGRLLAIDQRPVSFAQQKSQRLGVNLNFTGPFGKPRAQAQQNNPLAAAFGGRPGGQAGPGGQAPAGPGAPAAPGGQVGAGGFNPQVFQALRTRFCTPEAVSTVPTAADLEGLPQPLLDRVKNPDGTVNPERWAEFRTQMCNNTFGGGGGDPARFAQLREQFCGKPGETPRRSPRSNSRRCRRRCSNASRDPTARSIPSASTSCARSSAAPTRSSRAGRAASRPGRPQGRPGDRDSGRRRPGGQGGQGGFRGPADRVAAVASAARRRWRRVHRRRGQPRRPRALLRQLQLHLRDRERGARRPGRPAARPARRPGAVGQHAAAPAQLQRRAVLRRVRRQRERALCRAVVHRGQRAAGQHRPVLRRRVHAGFPCVRRPQPANRADQGRAAAQEHPRDLRREQPVRHAADHRR